MQVPSADPLDPAVMPVTPVATRAPSPRLLSIDVLRGVTIAFMILVNDPGDWAHVYAQLDHSVWNGCTLTDLVFPSFLFLVGCSLIFSLDGRLRRGDSRKDLGLHILRRAAIIFVLKMTLTTVPGFAMTHLRLYGVLTRIAMCYLAAGLICLFTRRISTILVTTAGLLVGYWALMRLVPVPGFGVPTHGFPILDPERNLAAWMDRGINAFLRATIHTGVLYEKTRDPEGLLSTIPATATTLLGAAAGLWLKTGTPQDRRSTTATGVRGLAAGKAGLVAATGETVGGITPGRHALALLVGGVLSIAGGLLWNLSFPINKNLWTSSYVLFAGGISLVSLALFYWLLDAHRYQERSKALRAVLWPWLVFGSNAIVAYTVSVVLVKTFIFIKFSDAGKPTTLWSFLYRHGFARGNSTEMTSLLFALCFVGLCFVPNWLLWRRKMFLKI